MLRTPLSNDTITIVLLICLVLITLARYTNAKRLYTYFGILVNSQYVNRYSKDLKIFDYFNSLIFLVFNLVSSAIIFQFIKADSNTKSDFKLFAIIFLAVFLFYGMKLVLELTLSKILQVDFFFKPYFFRKISYRHFFGILSLPFLAYLSYHNGFSKVYALWILYGLGLLYLISYIILIKPFFEKIKQNMFYFILYLCALEISPYVILYKLII